MLTQLKHTLEELRQRVRDNLITLYENDLVIQSVLEESDSESRSDILKQRYSLNKQIIRENREALKIQVMIVNYLKQFNPVNNSNIMIEQVLSDKFPEKKNYKGKNTGTEENKTFRQTINGELAYNESHPYYDNEQFVDQLLDYYKKYR